MKTKLRLGMMLALLGLGALLQGADVKNLQIKLGSLAVEEVPFRVESVSVSKPSLVRVEKISEDGRKVRISALEAGITDIQLLGGGMSQVYKVQIEGDLRPLYNAIKRDLDSVPELEISMNNNRIVLKGEVNSIANWEVKQKVAAAYNGVLLDLSTFRPTPEVMLGLQKNFEKAGFRVVRSAEKTKPGELSITQVGEMLTITGSVYNPEDLKVINSILSAQPWLTVNSGNSSSTKDYKVKAYVNVQLEPVMLQIDVVHIALSKNEAEGFGNQISGLDNILSGKIAIDGALSILKLRDVATTFTGGATPNGAAVPGTGGGAWASGGGSLAGSLAFFAGRGVSRARRAGFLTFKSNDTKEFRRMQAGGVLYLSAQGVQGGMVVSNLVEVNYGLILEVRGGLTGADQVSIELKQELSYPTTGIVPKGAQFDLKKFQTNTSIVCKLGETVAIAGLREFTQTNVNPASIPYLRNIPVLKWMVQQQNSTFNDDQILTLVCVHLKNEASSIDPVGEQLEKMKLAEDANLQKQEQKKEQEQVKKSWWRW